MTIHFDFYRNPNSQKEAEEGSLSYHARVAGSQTIEFDKISERISQRCTLSKGDIQAVIGELSDEMYRILCDGNRVFIPGIGYFYLSLTAPKDTDPKQTRSQSVQIKRIEFRADQELKDKVAAHTNLERIKEKKHSSELSIYEVDSLLIDYFEENSFLTRERFAELCQFTKSTACRHLKRLVAEGRLKNTNTPHNPIYEPEKGYYNK